MGLDEHTALLLDLAADIAVVRGRGSVTIRRHGTNTLLPTGTTVTAAGLRDLVREGRLGATAEDDTADVGPADVGTAAAPVSLPELMARARSVTDQGRLAEVILELEDAIRQWGTDTDEDQGAEQARAVMRSLIGRLGQAARSGLPGQTDIDPADRLRPAVRPLIALRAALREEGRFAAADTIRDALAAAGLDVRDTPEGTQWRPAG